MLTQERLKQLLDYDPVTGVFTRRESQRKDRIGKAAGAANTKGHIQIRVDGTLYVAHRLAWLYVHGELPTLQLDHFDGDKTNNRISNLRLCTNKQNGENRPMHPRNTSGFRGVSFDKQHGKFRAYIGHHMTHRFVGLYATAEEAGAAAKAARDELFTHHHTPYSA